MKYSTKGATLEKEPHNNVFITFLSLFIFSIEVANIHKKHPLKEHRYKFKIDKIT